jgi:hypothetical protein
MKRVLLIVSIAVLAVACPKKEEPNTASTATTAPNTATQAAATSAPVPVPSTATPAPASTAPPAGALATQETNWKGVSAAVTDFRRKGNTLTAKVHLMNNGGADARVEIKFSEAYLIDTGAGKKYNVLKDEKGEYIASLKSGWADRWYDDIKPGESYLLWMKFPAPPPETKAITLQIPGAPPFEDLAIQE